MKTSTTITLILFSIATIAFGQNGVILNRSFSHEEKTRTYKLYIPADYDSTAEWPLVINYHGFFGSSNGQIAVSNMNVIADTAHYLVAYPQGLTVNNPLIGVSGVGWNVGGDLAEHDDVSFSLELINHVKSDFLIDSTRIHITGWSMGANMCYEVACAHSDKIASLAAVCAKFESDQEERCNPGRAMSFLQIHGTDDPIIPFPGLSTVEFFGSLCGCTGTAVEEVEDSDVNDNSTVTLTKYTGCDSESEVLLYAINGGGHTWPGGTGGSGNINRDINGSAEILNFFTRNPLMKENAPNESVIESTQFFSNSLDRGIPVKIYKPEGYTDDGDPYRLYIFLHGAAGSVSWGYASLMKPLLDDLIQANEIEPLVVVVPTLRFTSEHGSSTGYDAHWYTDSERNGNYESVIAKDLLEWMKESYNVSAERAATAIGGFSMGADGALRIAARHSDKFIASASHDGIMSLRAAQKYAVDLFTENPGPPYHYNPGNGYFTSIWFGLASAYSPNITNPNMPEYLLDFPMDEQGNKIDSVYTDKWLALHDGASLLKNYKVCRYPVERYIEATSQGTVENLTFCAELENLGVPYTYNHTGLLHGLYDEGLEAAIRFVSAAMDKGSQATDIPGHDLAVQLLGDDILHINAFSNAEYFPRIWLRNFGSSTEKNIEIQCTISDHGTIEYTDSVVFDSLQSYDSELVTFKGWKTPELATFSITFSTHVNNDQNVSNDKIEQTLTSSGLLDDFENGFDLWRSPGMWWGPTTQQHNSGNFAMDDNPYLNYNNNVDSWVEYHSSFDLSTLEHAQLEFATKSSFNTGDSCHVEVSIDDGLSWKRLGEPLKARQPRWGIEYRSLDEYCGTYSSVRLRFHMQSDSIYAGTGCYLDDIYIKETETLVAAQNPQNLTFKLENYPNPFNPATTIKFSLLKHAMTKLAIYDLLGRELEILLYEPMEAGVHTVVFDGSDLASGLYFYRLQSGEDALTRKFMLVK